MQKHLYKPLAQGAYLATEVDEEQAPKEAEAEAVSGHAPAGLAGCSSRPAAIDVAEARSLTSPVVRWATMSMKQALVAALVMAAVVAAAVAMQTYTSATGRSARFEHATAIAVESKQQLPQDHKKGRPLKPGGCLCLFDVDRTLTARQYQKPAHKKQHFPVPPEALCQDVHRMGAVMDDAFGGGVLRLSQLGYDIRKSKCGKCTRGIISAGGVGGEDEKNIISSKLGTVGPFSEPSRITSALVMRCGNGAKHICAKGILEWFARVHHLEFKPEDVYMFDDNAVNIGGFASVGMNAHQVSCQTRDGSVGLCGGLIDEVHLDKGISFC